MNLQQLEAANALAMKLKTAKDLAQTLSAYAIHSIGLDEEGFRGANPKLTMGPDRGPPYDGVHLPDELRGELQNTLNVWLEDNIQNIIKELRAAGIEP